MNNFIYLDSNVSLMFGFILDMTPSVKEDDNFRYLGIGFNLIKDNVALVGFYKKNTFHYDYEAEMFGMFFFPCYIIKLNLKIQICIVSLLVFIFCDIKTKNINTFIYNDCYSFIHKSLIFFFINIIKNNTSNYLFFYRN